MPILLPIDDNGNPLPALGFRQNGTTTLNAASTSVSTEIQDVGDLKIVTIAATDTCHFEIGDQTVEANTNTSPVLFAGTYIDIPIYPDRNYISVVAAGDPCLFYIMERD